MDVGIGVRTKTGWAVLVALALDGGQPTVMERRRLDLVDDKEQAYAYHHAATLPIDDAAEFLREVDALASERAAAAVAETIATVRATGDDPVAMTVPINASTVPDDLAKVLGNHTLLHTGEGLLYSGALIEAGNAVGLPVVEVPLKELSSRVAVEAGASREGIDEQVALAGKTVGPPWRKEHKEAAAAAWLACLSV